MVIKCGQVVTLKSRGALTFEVLGVGKTMRKARVVQSGKNRKDDWFHIDPANVSSIYMDVEPKSPPRKLSQVMPSRVTQLAGYGRQWFFVLRADADKDQAQVCLLSRSHKPWPTRYQDLRNFTPLSHLMPRERFMVLSSGPDLRKLSEIEAEEAALESGELSLRDLMTPSHDRKGRVWDGFSTADPVKGASSVGGLELIEEVIQTSDGLVTVVYEEREEPSLELQPA